MNIHQTLMMVVRGRKSFSLDEETDAEALA